MIAVESHGSRLLCSMQLCVNEYLQSHKNHYRKREIGLALLQYYHIDTDCKVCEVERECMCVCVGGEGGGVVLSVFVVSSFCLHQPPSLPHCVGEQSSRSSSSLTSLSPNCARL